MDITIIIENIGQKLAWVAIAIYCLVLLGVFTGVKKAEEKAYSKRRYRTAAVIYKTKALHLVIATAFLAVALICAMLLA